MIFLIELYFMLGCVLWLIFFDGMFNKLIWLSKFGCLIMVVNYFVKLSLVFINFNMGEDIGVFIDWNDNLIDFIYGLGK